MRLLRAKSLRIALCLTLLASGGLRAAEPPAAPATGFTLRTWQSEDGLPQNTINDILQTRDGYLWFATLNGLARFDGVRFRVFGLRDGLLTVQTRCLLEDRERALWIGTYGGGLSRLKDGRIENWTQGTNLAGNVITSLAEDADGSIWIGTPTGLSRYRAGTMAILTNGLPSPSIRKLFTARDGKVRVATLNDGVFVWQNDHFEEMPVPYPVAKQKVAYCFLEDRAGRLWLSPGNGFLLCHEADRWKCFGQTNGLPFAYISCLAESDDGTLWAGSLDEGVFYLSGGRFWPAGPPVVTTNAPGPVPPAPGGARTGSFRAPPLPDNAIRSLETDQEGNLWIGTRAGGVSRLTPRRVMGYGVAAGLANEYARSVAVAPDGTVWVATTGGGLYSAKDTNFLSFVANSTAEEYRFIESVLSTRDGTLWWGGSQGLFMMRGEILGIFAGATDAWLGGDSIQCMIQDYTNGIWIGTSLGQVRHFVNGQFNPSGVDFGRVPCSAMAQSTNGTLWIGTGGSGLLRVRGRAVKTFSVEQGLGSRVIRSLYLDRAGALWVGTSGGGLSLIEEERVTTFTPREGLPDDTVSQILEDDAGHLWCGGNNGLFRLSLRELHRVAQRETDSLHPLTLGKSDGMIAEECSGGSNPGCARLPNGLLCFTTVRGIVLVDPAQQRPSLRPPPVLIEEVNLDGAPAPPSQLRLAPASAAGPSADLLQLDIPPGSHNLEFAYTAPSFTAPNRVRFRYQLAPLDARWVDAFSRRAAYYTRVPPGRYHFRVTACNADGFWNETGAGLLVIVQPHFWQTWWFLAALAAAVVAGIGLAVRFATKRKYARQMALLEMKAAIEQERTRIAKDIHDDLGANLTQITMLSEMGEAAVSDRAKTTAHFDRIAKRARQGVQSLDEIVWAVNPKNDTLPRLVDYICRYVDEVFENSEIRCWEEAPEDLPAWAVRAELRHNFFMGVKEATTNALKHSGATEAWLNVVLEGEWLKLTFRDNGHGFEIAKADFNRSGLKNMRARVTDMGGQFDLVSKPGEGTTVTFRIHVSPPKDARKTD
jgi:ligand-binding sensor domain-containing protein/signal transduction histidine kinase